MHQSWQKELEKENRASTAKSKGTGLMCMCVCVCSVTQSCPALCDPMGCSPPGSSVHRISQARILEWVAISYSRASSRPRDRTRIYYIGKRILYYWAIGKPPNVYTEDFKKDHLKVLITRLNPSLCFRGEGQRRKQHPLESKFKIPREPEPMMLTSQTFYSETCHGISQISQVTFLSAYKTFSPGNRRSPCGRKCMWTQHIGTIKMTVEK